MLFILGTLAILIIGGAIFINFSPEFGGKVSEKQKLHYQNSKNYKDGKFILQKPISTSESTWNSIKKMMKGNPKGKPIADIPANTIDSVSITTPTQKTTLTWFGHSTFLLQMEGKNILIDPMLGDNASPIPLGSTRRFTKNLPISIEKLPFIDFVIYSHDHYDHLDYGSVKKLKDKVGKFFVPLGLGSHLVAWGVDPFKIEELDWWDTTNASGINLVCTPAQHFSGRGIFDRGATLWASWVITGKNDNIYFSGDSGYAPHFKEIGDKYGPFDITLIECGQYDEDWKYIHLFPEETVQANIDLKGKLLIPIHWGAFKLSNHSWTDPIERASKKANELDVPITAPKIGEPIILGNKPPKTNWWKVYQ